MAIEATTRGTAHWATLTSRSDVDAVTATLRTVGLRVTPARVGVLRCLHQLGYATPDQLYTALAPQLPGTNASTVHRTLDQLLTRGLVRCARLDGPSLSYYPGGRIGE